MPYGIANTSGQPQSEQAYEIVGTAWRSGVNTFDTAQAYGDSEVILGSALEAVGASEGALVATKLSPHADHTDADAVRRTAAESCRRLRTDRLWCFMLHREDRLQAWDEGLGRTLRGLRALGQVRYLGVSVYSVDAAKAALGSADIDMIQVPCNAWDRRMQTAGVFDLAKRKGKLCLVRSVYLQGLLTLAPGSVRASLPSASDAASRWWDFVEDEGTTGAALALRYALSLNVPLVIGAETVAQVEDNVRKMNEPPMAREEVKEMVARLGAVAESVLSPFSWPGRARPAQRERSRWKT
jgi:aryl-alcohol dehydrogenase-like predicted oxidoreductase